MVGRAKPPAKRTKRGRDSYRDLAKLPKNAGHKTQVQHSLNLAKEESTMKKFRYGFNLMWATCPKLMKRMRVKPPGSYDKHNHHGGQMFGWPDECTLTNDRASKILYACLHAKGRKQLTEAQLMAVRKCLSYAWELNGGRTKKDTNWPCVGALFESVRPGMVKKNARWSGSKARYIPSPEQLRLAIEKGWTPDHPWPLMKWCTHYLCFWDTMICGARSKVDTNKIKTSTHHDHSYKQGWQKTQFKGGRSKLSGRKKGSRQWAMWRVSAVIF